MKSETEKAIALLKKIELELTFTHGLFACDNPNGEELFQLDHSELIPAFTEFIESFEKGIDLLQSD